MCMDGPKYVVLNLSSLFQNLSLIYGHVNHCCMSFNVSSLYTLFISFNSTPEQNMEQSRSILLLFCNQTKIDLLRSTYQIWSRAISFPNLEQSRSVLSDS
jgi:hypothetical protein